MLAAPSRFQSPATTPTSERPSRDLDAQVHDAFDSTRLLRGQREVLIRHGDETYRLRHTRNDKLILTK